MAAQAAAPARARELLLASTSPARRQLLDALGLTYRAIAPHFVEHLDGAREPHELARSLALGKAQEVAARFPEALVIGADQVCEFDGEPWGKPADVDSARIQLSRLTGHTHRLITGVALVGPGLERVEHDEVALEMYPLSPREIDGYLATREWEGCAGSYRVEARGQALFRRIEGDLTSVQGLPMLLLVRMLREAGVRFFE